MRACVYQTKHERVRLATEFYEAQFVFDEEENVIFTKIFRNAKKVICSATNEINAYACSNMNSWVRPKSKGTERNLSPAMRIRFPFRY